MATANTRDDQHEHQNPHDLLIELSGSIDLEAVRERYREERDRRIQPEGGSRHRAGPGAFGYYAKDPYTEQTPREPVADTVDALVIGAGFGGLMTASRLRDIGIGRIRIMDEAGDVGGTWYWNRYPGIRCDIEASVYMPMLDELGTMPSERYTRGEEIRQQAIAIVKHADLYRDALFHTRATGMRWDDSSSEWEVETDRGDHIRARYVVVSSGTLTQPKLPGIPGIETFRGHTFHTSRWDYGYTGGDPDGGLTGLADKRVAVVGTGATGVQVIPHVGNDAKHLFVF